MSSTAGPATGLPGSSSRSPPPPFAGRRSAEAAYLLRRAAHWDEVALESDRRGLTGVAYHRRLETTYRNLVAPGQRVLEVGCGQGDLLAALAPRRGVGVDLSPEMIRRAAARHPGLEFQVSEATDLRLEGPFDAIVLSDLVNDLWDVQAVLTGLRRLCHPGTRLILNSYSRLWELPLSLAERLGLARPVLRQNWLTVPDLENMLVLSGFEPLRQSQEFLWPFATPLLAGLFNRFLVKLWPFRHLALTNVVVARPAPAQGDRPRSPKVSVVIPARNEAGHVPELFERIPEMGGGTEIIFVEGHSTDDTRQAIERGLATSRRDASLHSQAGRGKGDAVRLGFARATGDVLMILDADITVAPEDLPRFLEVLVSGRGEFVNGVRLVYPMEERAMRFLNLLGNKFFSFAFSWLIGQRVRDTLCGTKVLWREDYLRIAANRASFGDFDPFGDFDLLFGAARQNLKIVDLPVRYGERRYGTTNIQRFRHGLLLLQMVAFAARRIKFI